MTGSQWVVPKLFSSEGEVFFRWAAGSTGRGTSSPCGGCCRFAVDGVQMHWKRVKAPKSPGPNGLPTNAQYHRPKYRHYLRQRARAIWAFICTGLACILMVMRGHSFSAAQPFVSIQRNDSCRLFQSEAHPSIGIEWSGRKPSYVFLHLHKTAGNNLKVALFGFAKRNSLNIYHTCRPTAGESLLLSWWFWRRKRIQIDYDCNLSEFSALPDAARNSYDLVVGHQYAGVHKLMREREVWYFTFMRDPVARKVSHFQHFEVESDLSAESQRRSLRQYLLHENKNYMTKRLDKMGEASEVVTSLKSRLVDWWPPTRRAVLRSAEDLLEDRFIFVGLQEHYAESVCVLAGILNTVCYARSDSHLSGIHPVLGKKLNAGRIVGQHVNFRGRTDQVIAKLADQVRRDTEKVEEADEALYERGKKLFFAQLVQYPQCQQDQE